MARSPSTSGRYRMTCESALPPAPAVLDGLIGDLIVGLRVPGSSATALRDALDLLHGAGRENDGGARILTQHSGDQVTRAPVPDLRVEALQAESKHSMVNPRRVSTAHGLEAARKPALDHRSERLRLGRPRAESEAVGSNHAVLLERGKHLPQLIGNLDAFGLMQEEHLDRGAAQAPQAVLQLAQYFVPKETSLRPGRGRGSLSRCGAQQPGLQRRGAGEQRTDGATV